MKNFLVVAILFILSMVEANDAQTGLRLTQRDVTEERMAALEGQVAAVIAELGDMNSSLRGDIQNIRDEAQSAKVFFTVCVDTDLGRIFHSVIKFDKIIAQSGGSNYNRKTGEFICPRHGIYYFQFTSVAFPSTLNINGIQKNGQFIARQFVQRSNAVGVDASSVGGTTECLQGDKIFVFSTVHQRFAKGCLHTFTGFMIHPL